MSLFHRIEDLRRKPEATRQRIALLVSIGITFIIFVFWFMNFSFTATSISPFNQTTVQMDSRGTITIFVDNVKTGFIVLKDGIVSLLP